MFSRFRDETDYICAENQSEYTHEKIAGRYYTYKRCVWNIPQWNQILWRQREPVRRTVEVFLMLADCVKLV